VSAASPVTVDEAAVPDEDDVLDDEELEPSEGALVAPAVLPDDVVPVSLLPVTGATAEDSAPADACDDVEVW